MNNQSSKNANKRKSDALEYDEPSSSHSKSKKIKEKLEAPSKSAKAQQDLLDRICEVELDDDRIFDNCQQVRKKINDFLATKQCTKTAFLVALGNVNSNSLRQFLSYKGGSCVYVAGRFFEKLRILNGKPEGAARKRAEEELPYGFSTETQTSRKYIVLAGGSVYHDDLGRVRST